MRLAYYRQRDGIVKSVPGLIQRGGPVSIGLPRFLDGKVKAPAGQSTVIMRVLRTPAR